MKSRAILIVIMCVLLIACAGMQATNQADKLNTALIQYGADLRWARINDAYNYHVNQDGEQPPLDLAAMEHFSITGFRPVNPVLNEAGTEATIPVEIDYYDDRYGTLKKLKTTQIWWYREEAKRWFIESDFPDFK